MSEVVSTKPEEWLGHFRLSEFRSGQKEVVSAVLAGDDCLCIMPTGGGKSLCYQLPAVMRPGVVLVISPLIALMKDQVDGLQALGLRATFINSSLGPTEQRDRLEGMAAGRYDLVYVAPERLRSAKFLESLKPVTIQLLAVDEAHCISEWGHDFRPDYSRIGQFRERLGKPQTIALTATATPLVRRDVVNQLQLQSPQVFITGFARPNLRFEVHAPYSNREKDEMLLEVLDETPGAAIIYASTRKKCETVVEFLSEHRRHPVGLYHAGMASDDRRKVQDLFMSGKVPVIVATNAFGMGIDKRDLRLVVHYTIPGSLEAYYQEAGRAGRDGLPSRCVLLFNFADRYIQEFFIENRFPSRDAVKRVYDFLRAEPGDPIEQSQHEIKERLGLSLSGEGVGVCEHLLEKCSVLERLDSQQNMAQVKLASDLPTLIDMLPREARVQRKVLRELEREVDDRRHEWVSFFPQKIAAAVELDRDALQRALRELLKLPVFDYVPPFRGRAVHMLRRDLPFEKLEIDFVELERRKREELERLERVISYAQTRRCRQQEILHYFGDLQPFRCEVCDNCHPALPMMATPPASSLQHDEAIVEAVRIVLSGVARTRGRIGRNLLAKMLCGSQSAQISQLALDQLSTFGLLSDLTQTLVVDLIQALVRVQLLSQSEPNPRRPVVQLTDSGRRVMVGQEELPAGLTLSPELRQRLQRRRMIGSPRSVAAGPIGELSAVVGRQSPPPVAPPPVANQPTATPPVMPASVAEAGPLPDGIPVDSSTRPEFYWTWRLLNDGYTPDQCRSIRRLTTEDYLRDLDRAAESGLDVPAEWRS